jgi:hypothetical protein
MLQAKEKFTLANGLLELPFAGVTAANQPTKDGIPI